VRAESQSGFTLVEIVAIIVGIVILAAIAASRYGTVSHSAKNALISDFFRECKTIYAKMNYGDSSNGFQGTNAVSFQSCIQQPGFEQATVALSGTQLTISSIPSTFFKNQVTTVVIDYGAQTYNGEDQASFLSQAGW